MPTDDTRQYIEITPSTDRLDPTAVTTHLRRMHALGWTEPSRIWQSSSPPTVEILLVSSESEELTYLIGVDDGWPTNIFPQEPDTTAIEYRARPTRRHDW